MDEITIKDGIILNRNTSDGFYYAGPLFLGLVFTGEELWCPTCGKKMERNKEHTEWFRCNDCKYSFNVLEKLPASHPIFQEQK